MSRPMIPFCDLEPGARFQLCGYSDVDVLVKVDARSALDEHGGTVWVSPDRPVRPCSLVSDAVGRPSSCLGVVFSLIMALAVFGLFQFLWRLL